MWVTKAINGLLGRLDLRLARVSSTHKMLWELSRQQEEIKNLHEAVDAYEKEQRRFELSQERWKADEPDSGLT